MHDRVSQTSLIFIRDSTMDPSAFGMVVSPEKTTLMVPIYLVEMFPLKNHTVRNLRSSTEEQTFFNVPLMKTMMMKNGFLCRVCHILFEMVKSNVTKPVLMSRSFSTFKSVLAAQLLSGIFACGLKFDFSVAF